MHLDLATALNIISTLAIVGALIFTALQVREATSARREQASMAMILATQSISHFALISRLPEDASIADIGLGSPDMQRALFEFGVHIEALGYMVHQRMVRLDAVDDLMGGVILGYWSRAKAWTEAERERTGNPRLFEWCQWIATQIILRHGKVKVVPAHLRDVQWRE